VTEDSCHWRAQYWGSGGKPAGQPQGLIRIRRNQ